MILDPDSPEDEELEDQRYAAFFILDLENYFLWRWIAEAAYILCFL